MYKSDFMDTLPTNQQSTVHSFHCSNSDCLDNRKQHCFVYWLNLCFHLVFGSPNDSRKVWYFPHVHFDAQTLISEMANQRPVRGWILAWIRRIDSGISPPPLHLNFTGARKCVIWPHFSAKVEFKTIWFRNEAKDVKSKTTWRAFRQMTEGGVQY